MMIPPCPLCASEDVVMFFEDHHRVYVRCGLCDLIFVPPVYFLHAFEERTRYDWHQNDPGDACYRAFLSRLYTPMVERIKSGDCGLDFGSGPGPTLSVMFEEAGHRMMLYDRFYACEDSVFEQVYDFVTATEVFEHVQVPREDLFRLWGCVKMGGFLGVMTKLTRDQEAFSKWHYKDDLTHVCFYSRSTMTWLAAAWGAQLDFVADDAMIFQKSCP